MLKLWIGDSHSPKSSSYTVAGGGFFERGSPSRSIVNVIRQPAPEKHWFSVHWL